MNWLLLSVFVMVAVAMIAPAIWRQDYRLQFPCLAGLTVLYQIALPLASLNTHPDEISATSLTRFSVMAILCLLSSWGGFVWWQGAKHVPLVLFNAKRLVASAVLLFAVGCVFAFRFSAVEVELDPEKGGMTGIGTIYLTLAQVGRYGAVLAAILFMRAPDWKLLVLILPQLWSYYEMFRIGRRSPTGEIIAIICMLLWFYRKQAIPLWLMSVGVFAMAVFCFNIGAIRNSVDQSLSERIESFEAVDPLQALTVEGMAEERTFVEVFNATKFMEAKAAGGNYTYGRHFWNQLVFGFVPAQMVGRDVKDSLMIPLEDDTRLTGFVKGTGTCETGIGEAFMAFGYFGCVLFFILGAFMRWLWDGASRNSILHQLLLMLFTLPAVMTFTLQIWTMINQLVTLAIFAGPLLWWSRAKATPETQRKRVGTTALADSDTAPPATTPHPRA